MSKLDKFFKFKIGDAVQPKHFNRSDREMSIFEHRFMVVQRGQTEFTGGIKTFYWLRGVTRECQVTDELLGFEEVELKKAEPYSECKSATRRQKSKKATP